MHRCICLQLQQFIGRITLNDVVWYINLLKSEILIKRYQNFLRWCKWISFVYRVLEAVVLVYWRYETNNWRSHNIERESLPI